MKGRTTQPRKLRVMISSQCKRAFPADGPTLTETRRALKDRIESIELLGDKIFEVWINEDAPPGAGQDSWDTCLEQVRQSDIVLVLKADEAGWALRDGEVGICHAELMTAINSAPGKVRVIVLQNLAKNPRPIPRDKRFEDYFGALNLFVRSAGTLKQLQDAIDQSLTDAVTSLAKLGVREARKGRYYLGDALAWGKLDFRARRRAMKSELGAGLTESGGSTLADDVILFPLESAPLLLKLDAIPSAMSVAAGRELVGRPFLSDHLVHPDNKSAIGPLHLVGCYGRATEGQGRQLLGFPDATVIAAPFGIYVADDVQKIQFVLLRDCRDASTTRFAVQRFLDWLAQTGEGKQVIARAKARRRIAYAIAKEL